jgi:hypothetical protein
MKKIQEDDKEIGISIAEHCHYDAKKIMSIFMIALEEAGCDYEAAHILGLIEALPKPYRLSKIQPIRSRKKFETE